jgi:hypothetical protein
MRALRLIGGLLTFLLVGDLLFLALMLANGAWYPFAEIFTGDVFGPESWAVRQHAELNVGRLSVALPRDFSTAQRLLLICEHGVPTAVVTVPMIIMALRLINAVRHSDPFTRATVRRLRVLGLVVLIGGALAEAAEFASGLVLIRITLPRDVADFATPDVRPTFWWLLTGFVLLSVAEVVRRGCELRDELDTVT